MHSIFFCNNDGMIIYKRYYTIEEDKTTWETRIFSLTHKRWPHARNEIHQCAQIDDKFVVFTFWGDVLVIVIGDDEYDELALSEILDILSDYIKEIVKKPIQELTENHLLQSDTYEKLCIGIDEIISPIGILDQTDLSKISNYGKIKTVWNNNRSRNSNSTPENNFTMTSFDDIKQTKMNQYLHRNGLQTSLEGQ